MSGQRVYISIFLRRRAPSLSCFLVSSSQDTDRCLGFQFNQFRSLRSVPCSYNPLVATEAADAVNDDVSRWKGWVTPPPWRIDAPILLIFWRFRRVRQRERASAAFNFCWTNATCFFLIEGGSLGAIFEVYLGVSLFQLFA